MAFFYTIYYKRFIQNLYVVIRSIEYSNIINHSLLIITTKLELKDASHFTFTSIIILIQPNAYEQGAGDGAKIKAFGFFRRRLLVEPLGIIVDISC
jgi:hypothetical protein